MRRDSARRGIGRAAYSNHRCGPNRTEDRDQSASLFSLDRFPKFPLPPHRYDLKRRHLLLPGSSPSLQPPNRSIREIFAARCCALHHGTPGGSRCDPTVQSGHDWIVRISRSRRWIHRHGQRTGWRHRSSNRNRRRQHYDFAPYRRTRYRGSRRAFQPLAALRSPSSIRWRKKALGLQIRRNRFDPRPSFSSTRRDCTRRTRRRQNPARGHHRSLALERRTRLGLV